MTDAPAALAKIIGTTLASTDKLGTPQGLGQILATAFYVDRTVGGGFLSEQAQKILGLLAEGIEALGYPVKHAPEYVWYLVCRYGEMSVKATTPSKLEIIYAAFFSEFSKEFAQDADVAMFRDLVEKIDYNEAVFLAGLWSYYAERRQNAWEPLTREPAHTDYHTARSLSSKGELFVAVANKPSSQMTDDYPRLALRVYVCATPALECFVKFVKLTGTPAI